MAKVPPYETTTRLVARALGWTPAELVAGFRPAGVDDLAAVLAFRRLHLGPRVRWDDARYLPWRYRFGRPGAGFGDLWALHRDGALHGLVGTEQMTLAWGDERQPAQRLMDLLIEPRLADSGLGAWLNQTLFRQAPITLAVGANELSSGLVQRLFTPLPPMRSGLRAVRLQPLLARAGHVGRLSGAAGRLADPALAGWNAAARWTARSAALEIRPLARFEDSDAPLPECRTIAPGRVALLRSGHYLNRRLFDHPRVRVAALGLHHRGTRVGYVAWRLVEARPGERELRIVDRAFMPEFEARAWPAAFAATVHEATRQGCASVRVLAQRASELEALRWQGLVVPAGSVPLPVGLHVTDPAVGAAWAEADWGLTEISDDGDEA